MKSFIHIVFAAALSLLFAVQAMAAEKVNINTADAAALEITLASVSQGITKVDADTGASVQAVQQALQVSCVAVAHGPDGLSSRLAWPVGAEIKG